MTRIVFLLIITVTVVIGAQSALATSPKTPPAGCQDDLFPASIEIQRSSPPQDNFVAWSDMPLLQREIWRLEKAGKLDQATYLRRKLSTQVRLARPGPAPTKFGRHDVFKATDLSYVVSRADREGHREQVAFDFNERLREPVKIPMTTSQLNGSTQLWMNYDLNDDLLSEEDHDALERAIEGDADLFLFNFLIANTALHGGNIILDNAHGPVIFNFGEAFRYSTRAFIFYSRSKGERTREIEKITLTEVIAVLRDQIKKAKFDWKSALNRTIEDLLPYQTEKKIGRAETQEFVARICLLRALLNYQDPRNCQAL